MHKTIHTEVRSSWHVIVSIHRLAPGAQNPCTPKAVECETRRKARQVVKETIHVWLQDRQPSGRHRTVAQCLPNGSVSKRADRWEVHTGQVNLFNTVAIGLPNSCVMNGFMNVKKPKYMSACSSCLVFCQISAEPGRLTLRHAVQPWDILSDAESYFTQIYCQEAHDKLSHVLSRQSVR